MEIFPSPLFRASTGKVSIIYYVIHLTLNII